MRVPALLMLVLLAGCESEPDFDRRYDEAERDIRDRAEAMEAELGTEGQDAEEPQAEGTAAATGR